MSTTRTGLLILALLTLAIQPAFGAGTNEYSGLDWIRDSGDILQIVLPVLGGGATFFTSPDSGRTWDREGTRQFVQAYGTAWTSTYLIKIAAGKARPNGSNRTSFPSGHTMSAFAGAAFIDGRFGRTFGVPAYALALWTGYSRVYSGWHYRDDVMAGASIGLISNWVWVSPLPGKVQLVPTVDRYGYGLRISVGTGGQEAGNPSDEDKPRGASYRFGFGPAFVISNTAGSQGPGENHFRLSDLNGFNDPTTTARINVRLPISRRGSLSLEYGPFEARDEGAYAEDVRFGGVLFPAGSALESSWRFYDLTLAYNHTLADTPDWGLEGSIEAGVMYSYATLATEDETASALVDDQVFYPYLSAYGERRFSRRWALGAGMGGMAIADDWIADLKGVLIWRPARAWDLSLGYEYFSRKIETDTFYNKVNYHIPFAAISRYW